MKITKQMYDEALYSNDPIEFWSDNCKEMIYFGNYGISIVKFIGKNRESTVRKNINNWMNFDYKTLNSKFNKMEYE